MGRIDCIMALLYIPLKVNNDGVVLENLHIFRRCAAPYHLCAMLLCLGNWQCLLGQEVTGVAGV